MCPGPLDFIKLYQTIHGQVEVAKPKPEIRGRHIRSIRLDQIDIEYMGRFRMAICRRSCFIAG